MSKEVNAPICECCWIIVTGSYDDDGNLVGVRKPVTRIDTVVEGCALCNAPTIMGIFRRMPLAACTPEYQDSYTDE